MSDSGALSPIPDDSHSSESADTEPNAAAASCTFSWPTGVAAHADAALELLAALNIPDQAVVDEAAHAVDRIRANADAGCADDLRKTQKHVHHAYAHAEHTPELSVRVAALDAAAAWRLAQYVYEAQAAAAHAVADLQHNLCALHERVREHEVATAFEMRFLHSATQDTRQHADDRVRGLYDDLHTQLKFDIDASVARASVASFDLHQKHQRQIQDLNLAFSDLQEKYDALNEAFVVQKAGSKPSSPARKWSLFSSGEATSFGAFLPA
jgi:hypothetical protein